VVSGGSTLSMQVARLLERGPTGTWAGKLRQMRVALALERRVGKDGVLGLYFALAPYGGNIEGLRAASLAWLGREPRRLTPAEIALLVALPQAPEARRPDRAPAAARAARDRVLERMAAAGLIDAPALAVARATPVPDARHPMPALAPHLAARLRAADPGRARHATTLDPRLQAAVQGLAARAVAGHGGQLSAAIVVADHATGEVLAEAAAAGPAEAARAGFVDMAVAPRSPGSTLKPFVYALAFDAGLAHPASVIEDRPVAFGPYRPSNFDGLFRGPVTVAEALRASLNTPVVQVLDALGPARLMAALRAGGARPVLPEGVAPGLGIALGGLGLSLRELAGLYAGLAAGGEARVLYAVPPDPAAPPGAAAPPDPAAPPGAAPARFLSAAAAWQVADIL
ncbi:MAG: transglycosylase domain-containing protein, partial [Rhodobacteraceae bacterium]|nr:transglycosylase domain-containing protein [Paracoccaceae bacterium]